MLVYEALLGLYVAEPVDVVSVPNSIFVPSTWE